MSAFLLSSGTKGVCRDFRFWLFETPFNGFYLLDLLNMFLFTLVTEGKRFSLPNARIMVHQPIGGLQGSTTEVDIQVSIVYLFIFCSFHTLGL